MKVLYLIPGLGGGGGAEQSLASMIPFWSDEIDLHLVTFSERAALVEQVDSNRVEHTNLLAASRLDLAKQTIRLVHRSRPDLVHTTLFDADLAGRLAAVANRVPVSATFANVNYGPEQYDAPGQRAHRLRAAHLLDAVSARSVSRFHSLTEHVAGVMGRRLAVRSSRIEVIPRGRNAEALGTRTAERSSATRAALGVGDEPLVVAAARHEWQKGLDVLIAAVPTLLAEVPNAHILIGGRSGAQTPELEEQVRQLGVERSVQFIGPRSDVPDLMCAADVFAVPSRWEGFGGILLEAMALEVPTVSTTIGPVVELAGSDPWLRMVPPDDPRAFGAALISALSQPQQSHEMAARGRQLFLSSYAAESVAERMLGFFDRAVSSSRFG